MLRKQYVTIYRVSAVLLCVLTTMLFYEKIVGFSDFIIVYAPMIAILFGFEFLLGRNFAFRINNILTDECDPEKFLTEYDSFYNINRSFDRINRYSAVINLGKYDEARQIIESAPPPETEKSKNYALLYYINAANLNIFDGKFEEAQQKLDYVKNLELPPKDKSFSINAIDGNEVELLRRQGHLVESRRLLNELLQRKIPKISVLSCVFALGLISVEEQKYDEAKAAFRKVIDEGNKLYKVTLAKQELDKIQYLEDGRSTQ